MPLPIRREDDRNHEWRLCFHCRLEYYERFPEQEMRVLYDLFGFDFDRLEGAMTSENVDLDRLGVDEHYYAPHCGDGWNAPFFIHPKIMVAVKKTYGGWIGVLAAYLEFPFDIEYNYHERKKRDEEDAAKKLRKLRKQARLWMMKQLTQQV